MHSRLQDRKVVSTESTSRIALLSESIFDRACREDSTLIFSYAD